MEEKLKHNIKAVKRRIAETCLKCGRNPFEVTLVGVTKYVDAETAALLPKFGVLDLGENRVQNLELKSDAVGNSARWHFIGPLQRNKVRKAIRYSVLIHSVDSVQLLNHISRIAVECSKVQDILLEVNVSGEESKHGFSPDTVHEGVEAALEADGVRLCGLMTMAPIVGVPEEARPYFAGLKELLASLRARYSLGDEFKSLSMGMSADFEAAITEGATLVRIGSLLYDMKSMNR